MPESTGGLFRCQVDMGSAHVHSEWVIVAEKRYDVIWFKR